jgi:hypothetical protein
VAPADPVVSPTVDLSAQLTSHARSILDRALYASQVTKASSTHNYLTSVQAQEFSRVDGKRSELERNLFLSKQMYLMQERERRRLFSDAGLVQWAMLAVALGFTLLPSAMGSAVAGVAIGLVAVVFAGYLVFYLKQRAYRRYDDWDKIYWKKAPDAVAKASDAASAPSSASCGSEVP